jgi:hypothetical protein
MLLRTDNFNALASDLDLNVLDQTQTNPVNPLTRGEGGQIDLQVDLVDKVTVAGNLASNTLAKPRTSVDFFTSVFTAFQCELFEIAAH